MFNASALNAAAGAVTNKRRQTDEATAARTKS